MRSYCDLLILQGYAFAYHEKRPIDSLLHNHLFAAPFLQLIKSAIKSDSVVLPDGPFVFDAQISVQIDMEGKLDMGIGFIGRMHTKPFIVSWQVCL